MAVLLIREDAQYQNEVNGPFDYEEMAEKANKVLGYSILKSRLSNDKYKNQKSKELCEVLKELDIRPFTNESVKKYQNRVVLKSKIGYYTDNTLMAVSFFASISFCLALIFCALERTCIGNTDLLYNLSIWLAISAVVAISGVAIAVILKKMGMYDSYIDWNCAKLQNYGRSYVPEFALQTALDIKEKCPEAEFYVHYTEEIRPDPFLSVSLHCSELYYIEVWNEPSFKAKREI